MMVKFSRRAIGKTCGPKFGPMPFAWRTPEFARLLAAFGLTISYPRALCLSEAAGGQANHATITDDKTITYNTAKTQGGAFQ